MTTEVHSSLAVLELTTVHYTHGDPLALVLAYPFDTTFFPLPTFLQAHYHLILYNYITLSPLIIVVSFVTLVLFKRDLRTATFFLGILVNEVINNFLKKHIKEARPDFISKYNERTCATYSHQELT